jgi:hypothetical protein
MAIQAEGIYVGLTWPAPGAAAALFDSPGHTVQGTGHALMLSLPAVGNGLDENSLVAGTPLRLEAGAELAAEACIIGGPGDDATAAIRQFCALNPVPPPPARPRDERAQVSLFADAYSRGDGYCDGLFRHAVWGGRFNPKPAADACAFLTWLAARTDDAAVKARARDAIAKGLAKIPVDAGYLAHRVSHIVPPLAPLVLGRVKASLARTREGIEGTVREMRPDGTFVFQHRLARCCASSRRRASSATTRSCGPA